MSNVLLVDDHQVVRDGLKTIIREHGIGGEFGEATTAVEALQLAADHAWDLAVVDISLPGRSGLEVIRDLRHLRPRTPVPRPSPETHAVDWYLEVLKALGVPVHFNFEWLPKRESVAREVEALWQLNGAPAIALLPGARHAGDENGDRHR